MMRRTYLFLCTASARDGLDNFHDLACEQVSRVEGKVVEETSYAATGATTHNTNSIFDVVRPYVHRNPAEDPQVLKALLKDVLLYSETGGASSAGSAEGTTVAAPSEHNNGGRGSNRQEQATSCGRKNADELYWQRTFAYGKGLARKPTFPACLKVNTLGKTPGGGGYIRHKAETVVPLALWTSVLPWEIQRGFSHTDGSLLNGVNPALLWHERKQGKHSERDGNTDGGVKCEEVETHTCRKERLISAISEACHQQIRRTTRLDSSVAEEEIVDKFLQELRQLNSIELIQRRCLLLSNDQQQQPNTLPSIASSSSSSSSLSALDLPFGTPGMLFVQDNEATMRNVTGYWSGAITTPMEVAFIRPRDDMVWLREQFSLNKKANKIRDKDLRLAIEDVGRLEPFAGLSNSSRRAAGDKVDNRTREGVTLPFLPFRSGNENGAACERLGTAESHFVQTTGKGIEYVLELPDNFFRTVMTTCLPAADGSAEKTTSRGGGVEEYGLSLQFSDELAEDITAKRRLQNTLIKATEELVNDRVRLSNEFIRRTRPSPPGTTSSSGGATRSAGSSSSSSSGGYSAPRGEEEKTMSGTENGEEVVEKKFMGGKEGSAEERFLSREARERSGDDFSERTTFEGGPRSLSEGFMRARGGNGSAYDNAEGEYKDTRYPRTDPSQPSYPKIDYELIAICIKLGIGMDEILRHTNRMCKEMREVQARRDAAAEREEKEGEDTKKSNGGEAEDRGMMVSDKDIQCMLALVADPAVQVYPVELERSILMAASKRRLTRPEPLYPI